MPSVRTHDFVTILLTVPTAAVAYYFMGDLTLTAVATGAMLFGGLMFGPDLDIQSRQYVRWGPLRFLWWPYKVALPHRSWFSHGILFGTLIRVAYFIVVVSLVVVVSMYARDVYVNDARWGMSELLYASTRVWEVLAGVERSYLITGFAGLWVGAASHTVTDLLGSFFKNVRKSI